MKDTVLLLATAILCSAAAWAFWHYLGENAGFTLLLIAFIGEACDNRRLRKRLRELEAGKP